MTKICRICLNVGELISLFDTVNSIQISVKIMACTSIKIDTEDNLPLQICRLCLDRLDISYDFKIQCEDSDLKLRSKIFNDGSKYAHNNLQLKSENLDDISYIKTELDDSGFNNESQLVVLEQKKEINEDISVFNNIKRKKKSREKNAKSNLKSNFLSGKSNDVYQIDKVLNKSKIERRKKPLSKKSVEYEKLKSSSSENDDPSLFDSSDFQREDFREDKLVVEESKIAKVLKKSSKAVKEQCFTCGKVMSSRFRLKMHMRIHTGEKPFKCSHCQRSFSLSQNLKVHERIHTGEKPLLCGTCGKTFAQSSGLVAHQRLHTGETPYSCTLCPLSFRTFGHLQYHIRQHTGEKNFECCFCQRAFITRSDLTQHTKTHTGERPYVCSICGLRMSRSSHLTRHMMTHSGEKPHQCSVCGSAYAQRGDLIRHSKKHSVSPSKEETHAAFKTNDNLNKNLDVVNSVAISILPQSHAPET